LPKPGDYKGTLIVITTLGGHIEGEDAFARKVTCKAFARISADGYLRVLFSDGREPIVAQFQESQDELFYQLKIDGSTREVSKTARGGFLVFLDLTGRTTSGPDGGDHLYTVASTLKLTRVTQ
jgi:hypothetical protein